ncbi:hypothetical protein B0H13DRAFT_2471024 [Mycena leptocephala]|nr:hypothetical protein B0H13DRAFT_2471024 [Mycena leptocephala]
MKREERGEGLGEEEGEERGSRRWRDKGRKKRESRDREGRLRSGAQKIRKRADAPALHIPTRARAPSVWQRNGILKKKERKVDRTGNKYERERSRVSRRRVGHFERQRQRKTKDESEDDPRPATHNKDSAGAPHRAKDPPHPIGGEDPDGHKTGQHLRGSRASAFERTIAAWTALCSMNERTPLPASARQADGWPPRDFKHSKQEPSRRKQEANSKEMHLFSKSTDTAGIEPTCVRGRWFSA